MDFTFPVDHRVKVKENDKIDKYLDIARIQKSCGTWGLRWYKSYMEHLEWSLNAGKEAWETGNQKNWGYQDDNIINIG